ncbi:pantoate--beta-alanine ligase [Arhodomonas sp. KWT2]|uniref:pantoate--beta-alanine ligase n=1 Tax=unclassified Arhodomonas TaxID=2621637 RepID=UPI0013CFCFEE|nr:pantoate--beta-alanine ligase [Arhodomonas sp. KWT]
MHIINNITELRAQVRAWRDAREEVGLVPTMGNLHGGHMTLVDEARERSDRVVVSIFVNPTQFGPEEDFDAYPRTLESDCEQLAGAGVDVVFAPTVEEMYPGGGGLSTVVDVPALSGILCGATRPGHFQGVATVVAKLLNVVAPDMAVFGRKDYQQLMVIRRMARDLNMPVQIVGAPVARESDGLAMSSRNVYLGKDERARAPALNRALRDAAARLAAGERDFAAIEAAGSEAIAEAGFRPDYFRIRRPGDLGDPTGSEEELIVLGAGWLGRARLIDNVAVRL